MGQNGPWAGPAGPANRHLYNGKELVTDAGLGWHDYGARWYDAALGRWGQVDPLAEKYAGVSTYAYVLNNPLVFVDPDGGTVEPAASLQGEKRAVFDKLRASNNTYNGLLVRYDTSPATKDVLHYRVGVVQEAIVAFKPSSSTSYAQTQALSNAQTTHSRMRGYEALVAGTVATNVISSQTEGFSEIGLAAVLIHEAVHAYILAENPFNQANSKDHHVPFSELFFSATLDGLQEYNDKNNLGHSDRHLMLLAATGLWGSDAVNKAFDLDPQSENYDAQLSQLKTEAKEAFKL